MSAPRTIDLNADIGEGCGFDAELVPLVTSVNIACGAHAGDEHSIRQALELARLHGVAAGAHPGFADRDHFGRRERKIGPAEAADLVIGQVTFLGKRASEMGVGLGHIKLHGALYNMASRDAGLARAIAAALSEDARRSGTFGLYALAGSVLVSAGRAAGLTVVEEAFADRTYRNDGSLTPRSEAGAVLADVDQAVRQVLLIAGQGTVRTADGTEVRIDAGTLCIHGDNPRAPAFARRIRSELAAAGVGVNAPGSPRKSDTRGPAGLNRQ